LAENRPKSDGDYCGIFGKNVSLRIELEIASVIHSLEQFIIMEIWIIWLTLVVVLAIVELVTQWLTTFCLAVGSVGALVANLCGASLTWQLIVLGVVTLLTLIVAGPHFKKHYARQGKVAAQQSNMDALCGRHATVIAAINGENPGRVKVDGDSWLAVCEAGRTIGVGQTVEVVGYDSLILSVK
jgi:membrane protein implicated in regulation of membrane protease activity